MKRNYFLNLVLSGALTLALGCSQDSGGGRGVSPLPSPKHSKPGVGTVVVYGDSLSSGVYPQVAYSEELKNLIPGKILNTAVPGLNSKQAVDSFQKAVLNWNPKVVILTIGGNDALQDPRLTPQQSIHNLLEIIQASHQAHALVVYAGILPPVRQLFPDVAQYPDEILEGAYGLSRFKDMISAARAAGAIVIEDVMEGIWLNESLKHDKLHPNTQGNKRIAARIAEILEGHYP